MTDPVISVGELASLGRKPALADVRWYLGEPEQGGVEYERAHLPGAVFVDLDTHLSGSTGPGRHPLPNRETFAATMGDLGFGTDDLIVAYDDRGGAIAARLWWMLRDIGHDAVRVLDGGITAWRRSGRLVATGTEVRNPATMTIRPALTRRVDRASLRGQLRSVNLLDARAPERYRGEEEPIAGHIPGAISAPTTDNLLPDETFLDSDALRVRFEKLGVGGGGGGDDDDDEIVVYCGSGVTACHNALAMRRAGLREPILYPGSWSDWSSAGEAVAIGPEPG